MYEIYLQDGIIVSVAETALTLEGFHTSLNNHNLLVVDLGQELISKDNFKLVKAAGAEEGAGHVISTKDGGQYPVNIGTRTVSDIAKAINDPRNMFVLLGGYLVQRNTIKSLTLAPKE